MTQLPPHQRLKRSAAILIVGLTLTLTVTAMTPVAASQRVSTGGANGPAVDVATIQEDMNSPLARDNEPTADRCQALEELLDVITDLIEKFGKAPGRTAQPIMFGLYIMYKKVMEEFLLECI